MPKTKISEFSATPGNNTDIDGINIAEGCAPSGINDAIRELMAQLKDFQAGTAGDSFNGPVGTTTAAAGAFTTLTTSSTVTHNGGTANGVAYLNGSKVLTTGSALSFDGTNLGIGATTPLQLLHLSSASAPGMQLTYQGVGASRIGIAAGNALTFGLDTSNGATEQMRLTSTGMGIGTSSPGYKLDVVGVGKASSGLAVGDSSGNLSGTFTNESDVSKSVTFNADPANVGANSFMRWNVDGSEQMRLDSSGNLGIGTTSISERLVVNGNASVDVYKLRSNTATPASTDSFIYRPADNTLAFGTASTERARITSAGNFCIGSSEPGNAGSLNLSVGNPGTTIGGVQLWSTTAGTHYVQFGDSAAGAGPYSGALGYSHSSDAMLFLTAATERARITSGGNLLVGTTSDFSSARVVTDGGGIGILNKGLLRSSTDGVLQVSADPNNAYGSSAITFDVDGSEVARIDSSGNLQLGATSGSGNRLNVVGTGGIRVNEDGASTKVITIRSDFAGVDPSVMVTSNHALLLGTNNTERARITSGGDFLVGTTSGAFTGKVVALQATSASNVITAWNSATTGDNSLIGFFTDGGTGRGSITYNRAGGLVAYNTTSDYRAKDIIGPTQNTGSTIDALKIYEGVMKGATQSRPMMIAHEAQAVVPFCVSGEKDEVNEDGTPKYQQMDHASLVPLLIAEIQSLRQRVAALEAK